jgi:hypothetical protein
LILNPKFVFSNFPSTLQSVSCGCRAHTADLFDVTKSMQRISIWKNLIQNHISNDTGEDMSIDDKPASWGNAPFYRLTTGNDQGGSNGNANYFSTKAKTVSW